MIYIKTDVPKELSGIEEELKTIYHSKNPVCFFIFKNREQQNEFSEKTKWMTRVKRKTVYQEYKS